MKSICFDDEYFLRLLERGDCLLPGVRKPDGIRGYVHRALIAILPVEKSMREEQSDHTARFVRGFENPSLVHQGQQR